MIPVIFPTLVEPFSVPLPEVVVYFIINDKLSSLQMVLLRKVPKAVHLVLEHVYKISRYVFFLFVFHDKAPKPFQVLE